MPRPLEKGYSVSVCVYDT